MPIAYIHAYDDQECGDGDDAAEEWIWKMVTYHCNGAAVELAPVSRALWRLFVPDQTALESIVASHTSWRHDNDFRDLLLCIFVGGHVLSRRVQGPWLLADHRELHEALEKLCSEADSEELNQWYSSLTIKTPIYTIERWKDAIEFLTRFRKKLCSDEDVDENVVEAVCRVISLMRAM